MLFNHLTADDHDSWDLNVHEEHPTVDHKNPFIHDHDHHSIHDHHTSIHDHHPSIHDHHTLPHVHHPSIHDHHTSIHDHHTPHHDIHPHQSHPFHPTQTDSTIQHVEKDHAHIAHQIESPERSVPQPFTPSTHQDTPSKIHSHMEHVVVSSDSLPNPVEHHQIDFNDFRKKRDANDHGWIHPSTITYHDKRIAGCIMQCIYKKNHAVDQLGWPTLDGLVNFYSEGVNEHGYFMATLRAVDYCLKGSSAKYHVNRRSTPEKGQTCDVAFDVFDCISDRITEYCSDHHLDSSTFW